MNKTILLTGANGFIGSHIAEYFIHQGERIKCLVRKNSDLSNLDHLTYEKSLGDVKDYASVLAACRDCGFVIHTAAYVRDWGDYADFHKTNVQGTLNVLQACHEANIKNIIITGSISSYGEENCSIRKDETSPFKSHYPYFLDSVFPSPFNYYRDTKAEATRQAMAYAELAGLNVLILEPVWVYGEREFNTGFYTYVQSVRTGTRVAPGSRKNNFHVIYARDLAAAYYAAFQKRLSGVHRIIVGNRKAESMSKIFTLFCQAAGLKPPVYLPKWLLYPIGLVWEILALLLHLRTPPLLMRSRINMFYDNIEYYVAKAKTLLDFENEHSLEAGIAKTVAWYKAKGYL